MIPIAAALTKLADRWEADAGTLERYSATSEAQVARRLAAELREALAAAQEETLTLEQASAESGIPAETLRKQLARGAVPNAGKKGAPLIRRGDLPVRPARAARNGAGKRFDPDTFVRRLHPDRYAAT